MTKARTARECVMAELLRRSAELLKYKGVPVDDSLILDIDRCLDETGLYSDEFKHRKDIYNNG